MRAFLLMAVMIVAAVPAASAFPLCSKVKTVPQTILCPTGSYSICTASVRCLTGTKPGSVVANKCVARGCAGGALPKT